MRQLLSTNQSKAFDAILKLIATESAKGNALAAKLASTHQLNGDHLIPGIDLETLTAPLWSHYSKLLATVNSMLDSEMEKEIGSSEKLETNEENRKLAKVLIDRQTELAELVSTLPEEFPAQVLVTFGAIVFLTFLLFLGEWIFLLRPVQIITSNLLFAGILSLAITIGVLIYGHLTEKFVVKTFKKVMSRRIARVVFGFILILFFTVLAEIRRRFHEQQDGLDIPEYVFIFINVFMCIVITYLIEFWILPRIPKVKEAIKMLWARFKVMKKKNQVAAVEKQIKANSSDLSNSLLDKRVTIHTQNNYEEIIDKNYEDSGALYKQGVFGIGTDGQILPFLKESIRQLNHFTQKFSKD